MSLDVYFGREPPPSTDEIVSYLREQPSVEIHTAGADVVQALYESAATGVSFIFDVGDPFSDGEDDEITPSLPLVLALSLNFNRPTFFALECFGFVERICDELGLVALLEPDEPPRAFDRSRFLAAWEEGNRFAVTILSEQYEPPPYMERAKADEWWRYAQRKPELDARFERENYDVFVPSLMLMHDSETNTVLRTVAWPDGIPIVVPPVDVFVVQRKGRGRVLRRREHGLVDAATALSAIDAYLRPLEEEIRILPPEEAASDAVRDAFAALPLGPLDRGRHAAVAPDGFVDVRPEEATS